MAKNIKIKLFTGWLTKNERHSAVLPGFENDEDIVHPKKNEVTRWNITECR